MLQSISSPPSEARSPPPARRTTWPKQLHSKSLQLHSDSRSLSGILDVAGWFLQLHAGPAGKVKLRCGRSCK
jgi:hypothetical protein